MKILLIQSYLRQNDLKVYPLGLARIASLISDHNIRICDLNLYDDPQAQLDADLLEFNPDVVGISLRNIDNQDRISPVYYYQDFVATIRQIKAIKPDTPVIAGGMGFSMFAAEIMERNPELDMGVYLEGDETFPQLLANLNNPQTVQGVYFRQDGRMRFTGERQPPDLDSLPPIQRGYVDMSLYPASVTSIGIESKRGCAFACTYCNYPLLSGNKVRLRQPAKVVDEIEQMVQDGIDKFIFADPIFNVPLGHASEICRGITKRNLKVNWGGYMDMRHAPLDFLLLARDAGCTDFIFSPDGISNNTLRSLGKGITTTEIRRIYGLFKTNERLQDAFVIFDFLLSPPGENLRGLVKTLWFYVCANVSLRGRGRVTVSWIRIEPGTGVHKLAMAAGQLKPDVTLLPTIPDGLRDMFFSQPSLHYVNVLVAGFLKAVKALRRVI